jgi:hypothetical protein
MKKIDLFTKVPTRLESVTRVFLFHMDGGVVYGSALHLHRPGVCFYELYRYDANL